LLALGLVASGGCGGGPRRIAKGPAEMGESADPDPVKKPEPLKTAPRVAVNAAPAKAPPSPPKPIRPPNITDWRRDDYYSARRDGDPQLSAAVGYVGEHFAGKTSAAELLIRLLEPSDQAGSPAPRPTNREATARVIEAIVAALAVNGTPLAWQTIDQLACGNLRTSDNQVAATAALSALLRRPGQENEDSLLRIVALAGHPPAGRAVDVAGQHRLLLDQLKSSASASLRLRLVNYMIAPETPRSWSDELWTCLQDPRPENVAAQSVLYRSDRPDPVVRRLLEQRLIAASNRAVGRLLGTIPPPEVQPVGVAAAAADAYAAAEPVWNAAVVSGIERRLATIESLEQGANLLLLASTIPDEGLRAAILRTFRMHWEEDPKPLEAARAAQNMLPEPGFLLLAKIMPRKDAATFGISKGGAPRAPVGKGPKSAQGTAVREAKQQRERITQQWSKFAENLLRAMGQQFRAVAKPPGQGGASAPADVKDVSLKLHAPADVVAAYRVDWPAGLSGKPAALAVSPLRIRYVRIEQQGRPLRVRAYYRRQLPDCEEHPVEQDSLWLDSLSAVGEGGNVRSIDVVVTKVHSNLPVLADQEQRLIIEVLAIECGGVTAKGPAVAGQ
jgi:hypothetical protein